MTWVESANAIPKDLKRMWYIDGTFAAQSLFAGPAPGTAAFQSLSATGYGPTSWQESSQYGIAAEAAVPRGDWTYEGFVYLNAASTHALFAMGGWSGLTTEDSNLTLLVYVNGSNRLACQWETGVNVTVTPSATNNTNITLTTWHHLGVVKDSVAKTLTFYLDGAPSGTATFSANPTGGDTTTASICRTSIGGYVGGFTLHNCRISATTLSTTKRDATWMAASYARMTVDGVLPTDASTWVDLGTIKRTDIETRGVSGANVSGGSSGGSTNFSITLSNPLPAEGDLAPTRSDARYMEISFDITNPSNIPYSLWIKYRNEDRGFMVYDSAVGFLAPFTGVWDVVTSRLRVWADGGWQDGIEWFGLGGTGDPTIITVNPGEAGSDDPPHAP